VIRLYEKFSLSEKRFLEMKEQLEKYKKRIKSFEEHQQDYFSSQLNTRGNFDVGLQVYMADQALTIIEDQMTFFV
jgi:hypothetical protein